MSEDRVILSVVVAAYNEEGVIANNLRRIVAACSARPQVNWELICINDGSKDRTGAIMDEFAANTPKVQVLHHRRNFGQGRALRTAFDICQGDYIVTLDADLSYGPDYIYRLIDALLAHNVEIALASPYIQGGSVRNVPFYRYLLSRIGNYYLAQASNYSISTSTCVVRAYRREILDHLVLTADGMELQLEVLMKAAMMGFRVCEVPANLEWADEKVMEADFRRVSKMRILETIRLYLMMGWLQRPTFVFILFSWLLIIPGGYMAFAIALRFFMIFSQHIAEGLFQAISTSLRELVANYSHSIVFSTVFLLIGIQTLAFSLLLLQNKFYFEEMYRLGQIILSHQRAKESHRARTPNTQAILADETDYQQFTLEADEYQSSIVQN